MVLTSAVQPLYLNKQFIVEKMKPLEQILGWEDTGELSDK